MKQTKRRIADAAADMLAEHGSAALTHRSVATRAGVTLRAVTYNFRTMAQLVQAAYETVFERSRNRFSEFYSSSSDFLVWLSDDGEGENSRSAGMLDHLILAVARDPCMIECASQLRFWRGSSAKPFISEAVAKRPEVSALDATIFSSFCAGLRRATIGATPAELRSSGETCFRKLQDLFA